MNLRILLLAAVALPGIHGVCHAQSPVQEVIDNASIQANSTNTSNILSMLQQQLTEAQKQSQSLTDQLTRMGDPGTVTMPALQVIKDEITKSAQSVSMGADREARIRATTGAEAFGDNAYGLMEGVGPTVTITRKDKDGKEVTTEVNRDPAKYKLYGAIMEDLNQLDEASKKTDERILALEEQRPALLDQISTATDLATVVKFQVALQQIDAKIAESRADLAKKKQDYDVLNEKLRLQAQIASRASGEAASLENQQDKAAGTAGYGTASPANSAPFGTLRWGKKSTP